MRDSRPRDLPLLLSTTPDRQPVRIGGAQTRSEAAEQLLALNRSFLTAVLTGDRSHLADFLSSEFTVGPSKLRSTDGPAGRQFVVGEAPVQGFFVALTDRRVTIDRVPSSFSVRFLASDVAAVASEDDATRPIRTTWRMTERGWRVAHLYGASVRFDSTTTGLQARIGIRISK
ncbi:MAG TPA: hypothetical protein VK864_11505 [Longimicrobiales bacterium]|nr:hypothetical protein [Longimicrobiales bacterium]